MLSLGPAQVTGGSVGSAVTFTKNIPLAVHAAATRDV